MKKTLKFNKESDKKWYIDLPHYPFAHHNLMMVAGADKLCELLSQDGHSTKVDVVTTKEPKDNLVAEGYVQLKRTEWSLTGGAHYDVTNIEGLTKLWLCPVTLFVYQKYPKYIYVKQVAESVDGDDDKAQHTETEASRSQTDSESNEQSGNDSSRQADSQATTSTDTTSNQSVNNTKKTENMETKNEKQKIYNLIIVDESGSMGGLEAVTLSGINETIGTVKEAQRKFADTQEHYLTLVTFDTRGSDDSVRTLIDAQPIEQVGEFKKYHPFGGTPLYDAVGMSLTKLKGRIKDDENATGVVTILTDGMENASHEWRADTLRQLIEQLTEEGWTFSYMGSAHDVKSVTDLLAIKNVIEFSHDVRGTSSTWDREMSSKMNYYERMSNDYWEINEMSLEEKRARRRLYNEEYYGHRVTPRDIDQLEPNQVFVFGSNAAGTHAGGAARQAVERFGAIPGQGEGLQGQSYAIPTMEGLDKMREAIERFFRFAYEHHEMQFLVTRIGCGSAGYDDHDVAPFFAHAIKFENVSLPESFWSELGLRMYY